MACSAGACRPAGAPLNNPATSLAAAEAANAVAINDLTEKTHESSRAPSISVTIAPTLEPSPRVDVRARVSGPPEALTRWVLPGPIGELRELSIRDHDGPVEFTRLQGERGAGALVITLAEPPSPPLELEYQVTSAPPRVGETARVLVDGAEMFATGESLLLLPEAQLGVHQPLRVRVDPSALEPPGADQVAREQGELPLRGVSTLAAEGERALEGVPLELWRAGYAAGRVETATFDSFGGLDRVVTVGAPMYDTRWVAAELAGIRSATDMYFGSRTAEGQAVFVSMLAAYEGGVGMPSFATELRGRGLVISAKQAPWALEARMNSTTTLVQRWLGGLLRVVEREGAPHDAAWSTWFKAGVSRAVARELLFDIGVLDSVDYLQELNALELELATSRLRERSHADLVALVHGGSPKQARQARALLLARGALYATWLDAAYRERDDEATLAIALRMLVAVAVSDQRRDLPVSLWLNTLAGDLERDASADFERVILRGARPELDPDALGPCFRPRASDLRRFELGFVVAELPAPAEDEEAYAQVSELDPSSAAAKAGAREGDRIAALEHTPGDAKQQITLQVIRDGARRAIRFRPAGPARRGVQWQRTRVAEEQCRRPR